MSVATSHTLCRTCREGQDPQAHNRPTAPYVNSCLRPCLRRLVCYVCCRKGPGGIQGRRLRGLSAVNSMLGHEKLSLQREHTIQALLCGKHAFDLYIKLPAQCGRQRDIQVLRLGTGFSTQAQVPSQSSCKIRNAAVWRKP